jgi:hypothetical protein
MNNNTGNAVVDIFGINDKGKIDGDWDVLERFNNKRL